MNLNNNLLTRGKIASRIMGALFGVLAGVVVVNEGYKDTAYKDSAGVWTICYGETKGVKKGDTATPSECSAQLAKSLDAHSKALYGLPESTSDVALVGSMDMAYNVGVTAFANSRVKRELAAGNYKAAGEAVLDWRYISKAQKNNPGTGWVWNASKGKWTFDCSQYINGKRNTVCWGLWQRRQWQSAAIGNQYPSASVALSELKRF